MYSLYAAALLVLVGIAAGTTGQIWWTRRARKARRRIPRHWPLDARTIVNSHEVQVWRWLVKTFPNHQIMVKLPITRFTTPRDKENSALLYELLSKVYCTFAVCSPTGRVIGCVDVRGRKPLSRSNQILKLGLLSQCGICYWVAEPDSLPDPKDLRGYFLAEEEPPASEPVDSGAFTSAHAQLRATVERKRYQRGGLSKRSVAGQVPPPSRSTGDYSETEFARSAWQQPDSFVAPLDSRMSALH